MTTFLFANNAEATLAADVLPGDTVINVDPDEAWRFPVPVGTDQQFAIFLHDGIQEPECVYVTSVNNGTFTVLRGCEGTAALEWRAGALVVHTISRDTLNWVGSSGYYDLFESLQNSLDTVSASVSNETNLRITGDSALAQTITTLTTKVNNNSSSIVLLNQSYTDLNTSTAESITTLTSTANTANATAQQALMTTAGFNSALASAQTTLQANINANTASITAESSARASGDQANANSITSLTATVNSNTSAISSETTARTTQYNTFSSQLTTLSSQFGQNSADISSESLTRADADSALSTQIDNLSSTVTTQGNTLQANINSEASTRASADTAIAANVTTLQAQMGNTQSSGLSAAITTEQTARVAGDSANTSSITSLSAAVTLVAASTVSSLTALSPRSWTPSPGPTASPFADGDSHFYIATDGTPVFANHPLESPTFAALGVFKPINGRTYRIIFKTRKTVNQTNGRPTHCHFGFICWLNNNYQYQSTDLDTSGWSIGTWQYVTLDWTVGGEYPWATGRVTPNWDDAGVSFSDAVYETSGYEIHDITESNTNAASITTEANTRAAADSAQASQITTLQAQMGNTQTSGLSAAISNEASVRAAADSSQATQISNLQAFAPATSNSLVKGGTFAGATSSRAIPPNWSDWSYGWDNYLIAGFASPNALRYVIPNTDPNYNVPSGASVGLYQNWSNNAQLANITPGWFVMEFEGYLESGSWNGAGIVAVGYDSSGTVQEQTFQLHCGSDPDVQGVISATQLGQRSFSKLVQFTNAAIAMLEVWCMANFNGFSNAACVDKSVQIHKCSIRYATPAEVQVGQALSDQNATSLSSVITTEQNARSTGDTTNASNISTVSSRVTGYDQTTPGRVVNPTFTAWDGATGDSSYPNYWLNAAYASDAQKVPGLDGPNGYQPNGVAGRDSACMYQSIKVQAGYWVIEADVTLNSGVLTGYGIELDCYDSANAQLLQTFSLNLATDPDVNGVVHGAGTVGQNYMFRKTIRITNTGVVNANFLIRRWSGFGSIATQSLLTWSKADLRSASDMEAAVQVLSSTQADTNGNYNAVWKVTATTGTGAGMMSVSSGNYGSNIMLDADDIFLGANWTFDRGTQTLRHSYNGYIQVLGGPFGANSNLIEWYGPASIAIGSMTTTNGIYARDDAGNQFSFNTASGYTKATGAGFGSANQFIEWFGPAVAVGSMTEANATFYMKTNGSAYFAGSIVTGTLKNSVTGSNLAVPSTTTLGPFSTQGNPITIAYSFSFNDVGTRAGRQTATTTGSFSLNIYEQIGSGAVTQIGTLSGTITFSSVNYDADTGNTTFAASGSASGTYTDTAGGTTNRTVTATLESLTYPSLAGTTVGADQVSGYTNLTTSEG